MTEFYLIRHAVNDWVRSGRLAGWTPGVHLNSHGYAQAEALAARLAETPLSAIYSSPLERTMETATTLAARHPTLSVQVLEAVGEVRYGQWQGAKLRKLRRERLWPLIQIYPSRAQFPGGEAIRHAQARAVESLEELAQRHPKERIAIVSHSDVLKLIIAHYLGMHIDMFQRLEISPASLSVILLGNDRPYVTLLNDTSHLKAIRPQTNQTEGRKHRLLFWKR